MSYLSDTLTVGVLIVLLFGSICLYLYTRIQQAEQKIHLLESILLDLKMSTEIKSYTEPPASESLPDMAASAVFQTPESDSHYVALDDAESTHESITEYTSLDEAVASSEPEKSEDHIAISIDEVSDEHHNASPAVSYESMTLKELQALAKTRGISGAASMKKGQLVEALKTSDRSTVIKPGSTGAVGANSFLETSALVSDGSA
jgi:hypothetical protein